MATQNPANWTNPASDVLEAGGNGIVPSKLSTTQRLALTLTASDVGRTVIDVTLGALFVWSGTSWFQGGVVLNSAADTQVLFDDGGVIAGNAAFTFTKTTGAVNLTGPLIGTSGTLIASAPQVQLAQVWNNAGVTFNGFTFNLTDTASAATSNFLNFQVSAVSKFTIQKDGTITNGQGFNVANQLNLVTSSGDIRLSAAGTRSINIQASSCHFVPNVGNAIDFGTTANTFRNAFFGGIVTTGSASAIGASSVALTNGAGASVGTLTNSPSAGNPTKWIQYNDNGTTLKIPAWT